MSELVLLSGLPRSGSTLVCNILGQHRNINVTPSSPLCPIVQNMKRNWSDETFLLAQLDHDFDNVYDRLKRSTLAFMDEFSKSKKKITVDKNRGWLFCVELLRDLYPQFKMIITLRDLRGVFSSVEKQHLKTLLLDFPDHMESNIVDIRADALFGNQGVVGSPVRALNNLGDIPMISNHLFYLRFEDLMSTPEETMDALTEWLGEKKFKYKFDKIEQLTFESDSHYRFKYPHKVNKELTAPAELPMSPRIAKEILTRFEWYYQAYYPNVSVPDESDEDQRTIAEGGKTENIEKLENRISSEIDDALEEN